MRLLVVVHLVIINIILNIQSYRDEKYFITIFIINLYYYICSL